MFEIPEYVTIAKQMVTSLTGKKVATGTLGNTPHKFVWYNLKPTEFTSKVQGRTVGRAYTKGRWLFVPLEKGYVFVFGECGGRIQLHQSAEEMPKKHHLSLQFEDGTVLTAMTQMWGAMELYEKGKEKQRKYICGMRATPLDTAFDADYFMRLASEAIQNGNKTVKAILTQDQLIPGLGNSIAQDIMFNARLHPKQLLEDLDKKELKDLHRAIGRTLEAAIRLGGRNDEHDLFGNNGRYVRIMDKTRVGRPCPQCGTAVEKVAYLGGACYFCPNCQRIK